MNRRPRIGNTILVYFFTTIILVFLLVAIGFNIAVRRHVTSTLNEQLAAAQTMVQDFNQATDIPRGPNRSSSFHMMLRQETLDSDVNVLFLDEGRELTLELVNRAEEEQGSQGTGKGWMGGHAMPMTQPGTSQPAPELSDYVMQLDNSAYRESLAVYQYVRDSAFDLTDPKARPALIDGQQYFLQSIPFAEGDGADEFVLAFIDGRLYGDFIRNALWILALTMIPVLILTFFLVRYLARRLATPIGRLQELSKRLGAGEFEGEDFQLREQELVDLNESLNEAASQLKDYHANQKVFFQNVSHELRTPLTGIRGYAEGIKYGVFEEKEAAEVILYEAMKLEKLVDDILYLSRIESNESLIGEKTSLQLSELLLEVREQSANDARINGKTIEVEVGEDVQVAIYYEEMLRALNNLVANGIRYSRSVIRLWGGLQGGELVITVSDDGDGLERGSEEKIFQRFTKGKGGQHGIGLSIAQAAVERHGGTIRAENDASGGARFIITLPMANLGRPAAASARRPEPVDEPGRTGI